MEERINIEGKRLEPYLRLRKKMKIKYVFDPFVAAVLLLLTWPLFLIIAALIKMDGWLRPENRGPVFYTEPRVSEGKVFLIIKFRTVPQSVVEWIRSKPKNRSITGCGKQTWAGKIILKWYLDELPQLINILRGEMSFVGPRPHIPNEHFDEIREGYVYRDVIKAGLLGFPQVCKQNPKYQKFLEDSAKSQHSEVEALNTLDGIYVERCMRASVVEIFLLDATIWFKGLNVVMRGEGDR